MDRTGIGGTGMGGAGADGNDRAPGRLGGNAAVRPDLAPPDVVAPPDLVVSPDLAVNPPGPGASALLCLLAAVLRDAAPGRVLSAQQRRYLAAVAADDDIWGRADNQPNVAAFAHVGLPLDRSLVRTLAAGGPMPAAAA
jgi:hypothetical protein